MIETFGELEQVLKDNKEFEECSWIGKETGVILSGNVVNSWLLITYWKIADEKKASAEEIEREKNRRKRRREGEKKGFSNKRKKPAGADVITMSYED